MWITLCLITVICFPVSRATEYCENVLSVCTESGPAWTRCYEDKIVNCTPRGRATPGFQRVTVDSLQEAEVSPTREHRVQIPSSALQRSGGNVSEVLVVASVINSTYFKLSPSRRSRLGPLHRRKGDVFKGLVLSVRAGSNPVKDLQQPVKLIFTHDKDKDKDKEVENGTCVFWEESWNGTGYWSIEGCETRKTADEFICSCNHLSFFAVLVNPKISVNKADAEKLSYITYVGSGLSALFTFISLIIYICLQFLFITCLDLLRSSLDASCSGRPLIRSQLQQTESLQKHSSLPHLGNNLDYVLRRRPEKALGLHMQLTGAMFCLHLTFLLCSLLVKRLKENEDSSFCRVLGLFLHWSLLASVTWTALEGFHLYLLLIRVFNIYVRRYLLKLSLVGWGFPTLVAAVCGISGVYGKYTLKDANNTPTAHICWMSSESPQKHLLTSYITTVAFPFVVVVFNGCMLGLVVFKMWKIRKSDRDFGSSSDWKKINKEKRKRLLKDSVTVLGLSCVLGLPWGLASTTYISLAGIYVFTIFNSLQGVFIFLWSVALTWSQSRGVNNSSVRDSSSQKMMTTSFNN